MPEGWDALASTLPGFNAHPSFFLVLLFHLIDFLGTYGMNTKTAQGVSVTIPQQPFLLFVLVGFDFLQQGLIITNKSVLKQA
jgi:hypothetical protein